MYNSKDIEVIRDDMKRIQKTPRMYIGYTGNKGFLHLIKEVLQNAIDEAPYCTLIKLSFDEKEQSVIIADNGRGIPFNTIEDVCTVIQSSGKYNKGDDNAYKFSSGLNGVGLKAATALSKYSHVISSRDGKKFRVSFKEGVTTDSDNLGKTKERGTLVEFKVNPVYMGPCSLDSYEVYEMAQEMAYLNKGLAIEFHAKRMGKDGDLNAIFCYENGLLDYLYSLQSNENNQIDSFLIPPFYIEHDGGNKRVEIAFGYCAGSSEILLSYTNSCTTIEGGNHVKGFLNGLCKILVKYVRSILSEKEAKNLNIINEDIRQGLIAIIHAEHVSPEYVGQVKEKDMQPEYLPYISEVMSDFLKNWLREDPKGARVLSNYIKQMAKIREDGNVAKIKIKQDISIFSKDRPKKYIDFTDSKASEPELFIIEGDSAAGTVRKGRDPRYQAIYPVRGKPKNVYNMELADLIKTNPEFEGLLKILGTGAGNLFDINKCRFKKIIIMSDSDVDGFQIFSLICLFFLSFAPKIIEAGYLYKAVAPLYRTPDYTYYRDKKEYLHAVEQNIARTTSVSYINGQSIGEDELINLMLQNKRYVDKLERLANRKHIHPTLLEYIIYAIDIDNLDSFISNIEHIKSVNNKFRFIKIIPFKDGNVQITGTFERESPVVNLYDILNNDRFMELYNYIHRSSYFEFIINSNRVTLGEMLNYFKEFAPVGLTRFKGLGEMDHAELAETTISPNSRTLIQLTMEDIDKELEKFYVLHSNSNKAKEQRKIMMANFEIDLDDIDN